MPEPPTLLPSLEPEMLLLADRNFPGYDRQAAAATGADLLWRVKSHVVLVVREQYADGSYLSEIHGPGTGAARTGSWCGWWSTPSPATRRTGPIRLITTILDPEQAPAAELAALYHERWEVEGVLDEIKVHQRGPDVILRSRYPDGIEQKRARTQLRRLSRQQHHPYGHPVTAGLLPGGRGRTSHWPGRAAQGGTDPAGGSGRRLPCMTLTVSI
ncbi:hypothetical protein [Streptomyces sp. NPDC001292]|uniref:hypothetical protein n=1 Tax=Streptomyces sp. NPDC001292 TaxID=3364558 RepID=UPI003687BA1F